ncbi:hypothetical protein ACFP1Z_22030 [Streptomyces gamaensis]|uniref:Uncharacterized protein n=1 Tax=Streptomyces gamaensis TaxID=1763542 RepID=A0ABW0Z6A8_9ACTN
MACRPLRGYSPCLETAVAVVHRSDGSDAAVQRVLKVFAAFGLPGSGRGEGRHGECGGR